MWATLESTYFSASFGRSDTAVLFALARIALFSAGFSNTHCVPFMRHRRHDVSLPAGSHSHRFLPRRPTSVDKSMLFRGSGSLTSHASPASSFGRRARARKYARLR